MTQKRYKKLMMSLGYSRNEIERSIKSDILEHKSYKNLYNHRLYGMDALTRSMKVLSKALCNYGISSELLSKYLLHLGEVFKWVYMK